MAVHSQGPETSFCKLIAANGISHMLMLLLASEAGETREKTRTAQRQSSPGKEDTGCPGVPWDCAAFACSRVCFFFILGIKEHLSGPVRHGKVSQRLQAVQKGGQETVRAGFCCLFL